MMKKGTVSLSEDQLVIKRWWNTLKRTRYIQFPVTLTLKNGQRFGTFVSAPIILPTVEEDSMDIDTSMTISWTSGIVRVSALASISECTQDTNTRPARRMSTKKAAR